MELRLAPEEADLLRQILTNYLSDLRMEIADTDSYELRQALKRDEQAVKALLARLHVDLTPAALPAMPAARFRGRPRTRRPAVPAAESAGRLC